MVMRATVVTALAASAPSSTRNSGSLVLLYHLRKEVQIASK